MKNKKKNIDKLLNVLWIFIIALLFCIGIWSIFNMFHTFNPSTDVCDEWECNWIYASGKIEPINSDNVWIHTMGIDIKDKSSCESISIDLSRETQNRFSTKSICKEWHPKNECELDSNAEGCVCDEYENTSEITSTYGCNCRNDTRTKCKVEGLYSYNVPIDLVGDYDSWVDYCNVRINYEDFPITTITNFNITLFNETINQCELCYNYKQTCIKSHLPPTPIKIDLTKEKCVEWINETDMMIGTEREYACKFYAESNDQYYKIAYDKYCCLKKEPLNECEKNNPDYVYETEKYQEDYIHITKVDKYIMVEWTKDISKEEYETNKSDILQSCKNIVSSVFELCDNTASNCYEGCAVKERQREAYRQSNVCRKKTIHDYSCAELKKALYFNEDICVSGWTSPVRVCKPENIYTIEQIYDIAISKGCDI